MSSANRGRSPAQWFCLIGGGILILRGAVGVALDPSFGTPGEGWHQLIHLSSGVLLVAVARDTRLALMVALGFGAFYAIVAIVGVLDGQDVIGLVRVEASDNTIHTLLVVAALTAGYLTLRRGSPQVQAPV